MKFQYILGGSGWAEGFIEVNSQRCEFNPSYLTDALGDLLDSLVGLLTYEPIFELSLIMGKPKN